MYVQYSPRLDIELYYTAKTLFCDNVVILPVDHTHHGCMASQIVNVGSEEVGHGHVIQRIPTRNANEFF